MKFRTLFLPVLTAAALALGVVPSAASAASLGTVSATSPLVPGGLGTNGTTQEITFNCPSVTTAGGPMGSTPTVTVDGAVAGGTAQACGTSFGGQAWLTLPDTVANSSTVMITITQNGVEIATGTIPTAPSTLSFQPSPSTGKTGAAIALTGSGISAQDGKAGVTINGVPATINSWQAGANWPNPEHIYIAVPQCVPLGAGTVVVTNANGASASEPFTVSATCNGKAEGSTGSGSGGGTSTTGSGSGGSHTTPPPVTGTGGTGSNKGHSKGSGGTGTGGTTTTQPKINTTNPALSISGPATLSVGGGAAYSLLPSATSTISWFSSNPSVASVSQTGGVTAHKAGTVTISASSRGKSAAKTITVTPVPPNGSVKSGQGNGSGNGGSPPPAHHKGGLPAWLWWLLLVILLVLLLVILKRPLRKLRERLGKRVRAGLSGARDADTAGKGTAEEDAPKDGDTK